MLELTVIIASHHFVAVPHSARGLEAVVQFASKYVLWGWEKVPGRQGKFYKAPKKVFAARRQDNTEARFHINLLNKFKRFLIEYRLDFDGATNFIYRPMYEAVDMELPIQPHWNDREHQVEVIEYLSKPPPPVNKLVAIQTGKGKSYSSMRACQNIGKRVAVVVRPMYLEKWLEDMKRTYAFPAEEIMTIRGSAHLIALTQMAKAGLLTSRIILISNKTMQNWFKLYEDVGEDILDLGYACLPDQFYELLQIGVRLIDEVHQDFHLNFKMDLYTHCPDSLSLSATLLSDDDFITNMYEVAYPPQERYKGEAYHKYAAAYAILWRLKYPNKVRTRENGAVNYSHNAFEQSIMKNNDMLRNYIQMISDIVDFGHFRKDYKPGNRCLLFCYTTELCEMVVNHLKARYPNKDVRRYCAGEGDPFENLMEPDIIVSTLQSAGTAVDVPQLTTCILTTCVSSTAANVQGFGRLRELSDGTRPDFYYLACEDIPKQIEYFEKKRVILRDRTVVNAVKYMPGIV